MRTEFDIQGAAEVERILKELAPEVASRIGDAGLRAGAKVIATEAKRLVPVDTGKLRDSIAVQVEKKRRDDDERLVVVGFKRPSSAIAHLVEFGTVKMAARPFMRPAADAKADEALNAIGRVMAAGTTREAAKAARKR